MRVKVIKGVMVGRHCCAELLRSSCENYQMIGCDKGLTRAITLGRSHVAQRVHFFSPRVMSRMVLLPGLHSQQF